MATAEKPYSPELAALAAEVMDLWQEHLSGYANDPAAKGEFIKLLEPQRRLFADWAAMMQNGTHGTGSATSRGPSGSAGASSPVGAEAAATAFDDSALRLAQLAHRVAELEKRMARLEPAPRGAPAKTARAGKPRKS